MPLFMCFFLPQFPEIRILFVRFIDFKLMVFLSKNIGDEMQIGLVEKLQNETN